MHVLKIPVVPMECAQLQLGDRGGECVRMPREAMLSIDPEVEAHMDLPRCGVAATGSSAQNKYVK